jgi:hypothetical protein
LKSFFSIYLYLGPAKTFCTLITITTKTTQTATVLMLGKKKFPKNKTLVALAITNTRLLRRSFVARRCSDIYDAAKETKCIYRFARDMTWWHRMGVATLSDSSSHSSLFRPVGCTTFRHHLVRAHATLSVITGERSGRSWRHRCFEESGLIAKTNKTRRDQRASSRKSQSARHPGRQS